MIQSLQLEKSYVSVAVVSLAIHTFALGVLQLTTSGIKTSTPQVVKVRVVESTPQAIPSPPPPKREPQALPKKPEQREARGPIKPQAERVQGLTKESVSDQGTIAAPVGNSLMIEDKGKRLTPEEIANLKQDLSSPPLLIAASYVKPSYTEAAVAANLEGRYVVEVFIDENGAVKTAELKKKIGFGMDDKIIAATLKARFIAAKNEKGVPYAAWGEFTITLELE